MKALRHLILLILAMAAINSCEKDEMNLSSAFSGYDDGYNSLIYNKAGVVPKATGSIEFVWNGGGKKGDMGNQPEEMRAFFEFNAHEAFGDQPAKGEITFSVVKPDLEMHREIKAEVFDVLVDVINKKAYILGLVVSDTKGCSGGPSGGHDSQCGDSGHTDGDTGCGDDSTDHDGGCSHDDTGTGGTDGGGCSDGGTDGGGCSDGGTDEGGCSDGGSGGTGGPDSGMGGSTGGTDGGGCSDGGTDEGGCSDGGSGGSGGPDSGMGGSPGGTDKGNPLAGKYCRTGQIIVLKVHDVGTPGTNGDGITWKWFAGDSDFKNGIGDVATWKHLCKKTILAGNIVVHQ